MKANFFSIFLLSFFSVGLIFSEGENSDKPIADTVVEKPAVGPDSATKGAIIEAIFILQNKKNSLVRHLRRVKIALLEIDHLIKDLVYERQVLFDHFYRNKMQVNGANMIDRILVDLSIFYDEILNINLIKGIYPNYLKQIQRFVDDIDNVIEQFVNGGSLITFCDLKMKIDKFDNILDIIEKEERLLKLVLEVENIKLSCKKYKDRIKSRYSQLELYENGVKNKEDAFFLDQKDLIDSSIKRLKKNMSKSISDLEGKQDKIKSLKQNLLRHYNEHQMYSFPKLLCPRGAKLHCTENVKLKSSKAESLGWFIDTLEDIRKKLNRNFNIEDSV